MSTNSKLTFANFATKTVENVCKPKVKKPKRKTISDAVISDDAVVSIVNMVFDKVENPATATQKEIVSILMHTELSSTTISRVVNLALPTAKSTPNSINSLIKHIRACEVDERELLAQIEKDIINAEI